MNDALMPYAGAVPMLASDSRRAARRISKYEARTQERLALVDKETDVTLAKEDSATTVDGHGMTSITRMAQLQTQCEQMAPAASGRLAMLADFHAMSMVEIAADHQRVLRRR